MVIFKLATTTRNRDSSGPRPTGIATPERLRFFFGVTCCDDTGTGIGIDRHPDMHPLGKLG
jgi:hypothetical protein